MSCYWRTNILCWELRWKKQSFSATTRIQARGGKPVPVTIDTAAPAALRVPGGLSWGWGGLLATRDAAADQSQHLAWVSVTPGPRFLPEETSPGFVVVSSEGLLLSSQLRRERGQHPGHVRWPCLAVGPAREPLEGTSHPLTWDQELLINHQGWKHGGRVGNPGHFSQYRRWAAFYHFYLSLRQTEQAGLMRRNGWMFNGGWSILYMCPLLIAHSHASQVGCSSWWDAAGGELRKNSPAEAGEPAIGRMKACVLPELAESKPCKGLSKIQTDHPVLRVTDVQYIWDGTRAISGMSVPPYVPVKMQFRRSLRL